MKGKNHLNQIAVWQMTSDLKEPIRAVTLAQPASGLDATSRQIPGGAYSTFRTFSGNRMIQYAAHMDRLEETARLAGTPVQIDRVLARSALRAAVQQFPSLEKRVRLTLDLEQQPGRLFIAIESLVVPTASDYTEGVRAVTRQAHRENPKAKLTRFIATAGEIRQEIPQGVNEALMVAEDGFILEGLSSNFFAIQDGQLYTAEEGVLSGLTRRLVLEEAGAEGIPVVLQPIALQALPMISEAFITSASRAVLPVVQIDGQPVGDARPGPVTLRLLERYEARIQAESEEI